MCWKESNCENPDQLQHSCCCLGWLHTSDACIFHDASNASMDGIATWTFMLPPFVCVGGVFDKNGWLVIVDGDRYLIFQICLLNSITSSWILSKWLLSKTVTHFMRLAVWARLNYSFEDRWEGFHWRCLGQRKASQSTQRHKSVRLRQQIRSCQSRRQMDLW